MKNETIQKYKLTSEYSINISEIASYVSMKCNIKTTTQSNIKKIIKQETDYYLSELGKAVYLSFLNNPLVIEDIEKKVYNEIAYNFLD